MKIYLIFISFIFLGFFWGKPDYSKAELILKEMEKSLSEGDCASVWEKYEEFSAQKPPQKMKKKSYLYSAQCYERYGSYEKALSIYKLGMELYPKDLIFMKKAADLYLKNSIYQKALDLGLKLEKENPHDQENWLLLARSYGGTGFWRKSVYYYRKTAALNLKNYDLVKEYSTALKKGAFYKEGYGLAIKAAQESHDADFYILAAEISALSGDLSKALVLLSELSESGKCSLKCHKMKAVYCLFTNRYDSAKKELDFIEEDKAFYYFISGLLDLREGKSSAKDKFLKSSFLGEGFIKKASQEMISEGDK
ncbi:MAG: hypothetical protein AB1637_08310 [Elusimicrobiota bacterium]